MSSEQPVISRRRMTECERSVALPFRENYVPMFISCGNDYSGPRFILLRCAALANQAIEGKHMHWGTAAGLRAASNENNNRFDEGSGLRGSSRAARVAAAALLGMVLLGGYVVAKSARAQTAASAAPAYDVVIRNGKIVDGTGSPWFAGDIGIRNGRIVAIGKVSGEGAKQVIDAAGRVVAPGFIDMLGQSELTILVDPRLPSKIYQGITTEITGEGNSIAAQTD